MSIAPLLLSTHVETVRGALAIAVLPSGHDADADAERVDLLHELERLTGAIACVQADLAVDLDASQRAQQAAAGVPAARQGTGVAAQVALARQESPHRGQVHLGLAKALRHELPHTRFALRTGVISEHAALLITRETACLDPVDRAEVDETLCADHDALRGLGLRRLVGTVRRLSAAIDPASVAERARRAETERCVTLRPAPDTMTYLTALLPVAQGVAAYAALTRDTATLRGTGDPRTRGQVMADLLVERVTGQTEADAVPVSVDLVISDATLFGAGQDPGVLTGAGADTLVPAQIARELVARALDAPTDTWLRRLYATAEGDLIAMTSRQRFVRGGLADFLRVRDQGLCRTPWCDAPARHFDHVQDADDGGPTTALNTQGLCEACNHAKQAIGWVHRPRPGPGRHIVDLTTPTGHRHVSVAPEPPVPARPVRTALDHALDRILQRVGVGPI